jgi:ABC-type transport system involved in cytochrome c biogenesis permease component
VSSRAVWLLFRKDVRVLVRSPVLLAALLAYPVVIAVLVGLVAGYASSKPRVAFVDRDHLPPVVAVGGRRFHLQTVVDQVATNVTLVRLPQAEAARELASGEVVATITVPPGFLKKLATGVETPSLILRTARGGLTATVTEQTQALVYRLNRKLQSAFIEADLAYVNLILHGGPGSFLGRHFDVLGLERMQAILDAMPPSQRRTQLDEFARVARLALAQTGNALAATANPIDLVQPKTKGRTWALSAQVQAYGIALTVTFLALLLAAGAAAAEKDEGTIGRLGRGLVSWGQLVAAKVALAAAAAVVLGGAIAIVFGIVVEAGGVTGGEPWARLPLLLVGVGLAGAVVGAAGALLGALAREARTASLVAVLVVLPVCFLGLVPSAVAAPAAWISNALPFVHAVRFFGAALFDTSPWRRVGVEAAWLIGIGAVFAGLARAGMRRLAA